MLWEIEPELLEDFSRVFDAGLCKSVRLYKFILEIYNNLNLLQVIETLCREMKLAIRCHERPQAAAHSTLPQIESLSKSCGTTDSKPILRGERGHESIHYSNAYAGFRRS